MVEETDSKASERKRVQNLLSALDAFSTSPTAQRLMSERKSKWDEADAGPSSSEPSQSMPPPMSAASAAAAAAAKIAAQLAANAPVRSDRASDGARDPKVPEAEFQHDIEINDLRNRYMLTKGQTQQQIFQETGASVGTKGIWYPDKSLAKAADERPLYLHIEASTQAILDTAIAKVQELIDSDLPDLSQDRRNQRAEYDNQTRPPFQDRRPTNHEGKVTIGVDQLRNFNVRAKVVGPQGMFVKYIQQETGTRVQLKGIGSGFVERDTGREAEEPLFIHIIGQQEDGVKEATTLAEDLVDAVRTEWQKARTALNEQFGGGMGMMGGHGGPMGVGAAGGDMGAGGQGWAGRGGGYGSPAQGNGPYPSQQQQQPAAGPSPEDAALIKYWKDYVAWEKSFVAYHKRNPTKEEGGQDVPPQYRS